MTKWVSIECTFIDDLIGEQTDCEDCILDGCPCPSCEEQKDCKYPCGAVRFARKMKTDLDALCKWLEDHGESIENGVPAIAAEVIRNLRQGQFPEDGIGLIAAERRRQQEKEGWSADHDDEHEHGEMSIAAACYAVEGTDAHVVGHDYEEDGWPWAEDWDKRKKHDRLRRLVIAGALIAAEIDRELRERGR